MERLNAVEVKHYPFTKGEPIYSIRDSLCKEMRSLLGKLDLSDIQQREWMSYFSIHLVKTEDLYLKEETLREKGEERANLTYHGRRHGIYQATYDAIGLAKAVLERGDDLSKHLTLEGVFSIVDSQIKHDIGYVEEANSRNFAGRLPVHVARSIRIASSMLYKFGLPSSLNLEKVNELERLGIHATNFPFDNDKKVELTQMLAGLQHSSRQEAHIVRLIGSLADLGGQVARIDYPKLLVDLRNEFNSEISGKGDTIIGQDHEIVEKCRGFIEDTLVKGQVGKISNAFLGKDNIYQRVWRQHINSLSNSA